MRPANWDVALATWAGDQLGRPFVWGETDCVTLCFAGLERVAGHAVVAVPKYTTEAEARQLVPFGGRLGQQMAILGYQVQPTFAQSGDVVVLPASDGEFSDGLGLVVGTNQVLVADLEEGVRTHRLAAVLKVAKVEVYRLADL